MQSIYSEVLNATDRVESRKAGEIIFEMGEPGQVMYIILAGTVEIRVGDRVFYNGKPGETVGEMAILEDTVRSATAVAVTDCEILPIEKPRLLEMVQQHPLIAIEMTKSMVRRLRYMNHLAQYDTLTQLPNRTLFRERCQTALQRSARRKSYVGVLHLDLDNFENINDSLGYTFADELLGQVAVRLQGAVHEADVLARLGADEFAVLVDGVFNETDLAVAAQDLLDSLAAPFTVNGDTLYITASIGITFHPVEGNNVETLLKNADTAMHSAKQAGRNQYAFFSTGLNARALEFLTIKNALRKAIDQNELSLHYQPRVNLMSGEILGVEALMRWRHPTMGNISPAQFIPIAEESNLILTVGEWALRQGCKQRKAWLDAGLRNFRVAINLSVKQMDQDNLTDKVRQILAETNLPANLLELEITESCLMSNSETMAEKLRTFREMGIAIALDDFGTGYSSLSYLKRFPLDCMKIDQSFVRGIPQNTDDIAITRMIIALARNMGLTTVIEGVETEDQLSFAKIERCDEFQGFLFSKPLPAAEVELLLRRI